MLIWRRDGRCSVVIGICGRTHFQLWLTVKIRFPFIGFRVLSHFPLQMAPSPPGYSGSAGSSGYAGQKWLGARFHGMEEVIGSIPIRSTKQPYQFQLVMSCIVSSETVREGVEGC